MMANVKREIEQENFVHKTFLAMQQLKNLIRTK